MFTCVWYHVINYDINMRIKNTFFHCLISVNQWYLLLIRGNPHITCVDGHVYVYDMIPMLYLNICLRGLVLRRCVNPLNVKCSTSSLLMVPTSTIDIYLCFVTSWRLKVTWWLSHVTASTDKKLVLWLAAPLRKRWVIISYSALMYILW